MKKIFFLLILFSLIPAFCQANQVQLETTNTNCTISLVTEKPLQLGAFDIQLNYSGANTKVVKIDGIEPFILFMDIDNINGVAKIAGFAQKDPSAGMKTGMATVLFEGGGKFDLIVSEVLDTSVQPIPVANTLAILPTVTPLSDATVLPEYEFFHPQSPIAVADSGSTIPQNPVITPVQTQLPGSNPPTILLQTTQPVITRNPAVNGAETSGPAVQQPMPDTSIREKNTPESALQTTVPTQQRTPSSAILSFAGLFIVCFIYLKRNV